MDGGVRERDTNKGPAANGVGGRFYGNNYDNTNRVMKQNNFAMMSLFFFEGFTYNISKKELWEVFQKWGKVWGIFICQRQNNGGNFFGFVQFLDIHNMHESVRKLGNIYINQRKL